MMDGGVHEEERLPPGFRFHPTDEELITYYLRHKIMESNFSARAIAEADLNKCEPWDLPGKAKMGEKEWYFFSLRDRKYPTGVRTNRATSAGYWKTTGKDREIFNGNNTELVGMKKTLVFYKGRAPRGEKSNWVMHEYRLHSKSPFKGNKDEWVVCRIFMKSSGGAAAAAGKKYPSNQARSNPYHLDSTVSGASIIPSLLPKDPSYLTTDGRRLLTSTTAELMELSKLARANHGGLSLPILPHLNYTGGFTLSGLNLNIGAPQAPVQPRPPVLGGTQTPVLQPQVLTADHQQPNPVLPNCIMGIDGGFNADVNSIASGSRYHQNMDSLELEGYWPSY